MSLLILLDAGPLGMITNPRSSPESEACKNWLASVAITTPVMLKAAEFWASARKIGRQSASDASLDADMILAAQAAILTGHGDEAVVATTNVRHLALFAPARVWREIR
jgi:hypothetical protein